MVPSRIRYKLSRLLKRLGGAAILDSEVHPTAKVNAGTQFAYSSIGRHSYCGFDCTIIHTQIGAFCSLADRIYIGGSGHPMHFVSTSPAFLAELGGTRKTLATLPFRNYPKTVIGHDVWIGQGASVRAGLRVGNGAVIGMGAVVTRDVPDYGVVAGNPARLIRRRFDDDTCEALSQSKWWESSDAELSDMGELMVDPAVFLKKLVER